MNMCRLDIPPLPSISFDLDFSSSSPRPLALLVARLSPPPPPPLKYIKLRFSSHHQLLSRNIFFLSSFSPFRLLWCADFLRLRQCEKKLCPFTNDMSPARSALQLHPFSIYKKSDILSIYVSVSLFKLLCLFISVFVTLDERIMNSDSCSKVKWRTKSRGS